MQANEKVAKTLANDVKDETTIESDREMIDMIQRIQEMEKDIDKRIYLRSDFLSVHQINVNILFTFSERAFHIPRRKT
jgi:hypothetical protein